LARLAGVTAILFAIAPGCEKKGIETAEAQATSPQAAQYRQQSSGRSDRVPCPALSWPYSRNDAGPHANAPEQRIRELRWRSWRGDFFAQVKLGDIYAAADPLDRNYFDKTEAAVWYVVALANPAGYLDMGSGRDNVEACRRRIRYPAYQVVEGILEQMSGGEIAQVRDRAVYILSSQGADGLITLGRINDDRYGPYGEPSYVRATRREGVTPFAPRAVDAWVFYFLAAQTGDPMAKFYLNDFNESTRRETGDYNSFAREKAYRWIPPFEVYPVEPRSASALPYTDESCGVDSADRDTLERIFDEVPRGNRRQALSALGYLSGGRDYKDAVTRFQRALREPETGDLTPLQQLRAIQIAAERGSAEAQTTLGVMYTKGVGVCRGQSYARAYHWFRKAADQRAPAALYALSRYYDEGVDAIADQDIARSVTYSIASAQAGFWPTEIELKRLLRQAGREGRKP
jgi:hypothetical protein